ncbi:MULTISPECIES: hypothetical protein [unclassified Pseudomonas]|uniref:hypothetical protein n=1 Tax=unclassified Pseudomonas TaxID=196821 RepID=UPI0030DAE66F
MNEDVVARINNIAPETYLRISYYKSNGELSNMDQGWLKTVDLDAGTLSLKSSNYDTLKTVWINNIKSANDIDDTHTGSGSAGPAVSGGMHWVAGVGWQKN